MIKKSPRSRSSEGCKSLILYTNTSWSKMSPRWARSLLKFSLTSSLKRRWRLPPTTPWNQAMVEGSQSLRTKLPTMLMIYNGDKLLVKGKRSRSSFQIHSETTCQWDASLRWSSRSTRSSTPSKTSPWSDARDQSNTIPRFSGWRNTVHTMTVNGTKPSTVGPIEGAWRSLSSRTYLKSTFLLPK